MSTRINIYNYGPNNIKLVFEETKAVLIIKPGETHKEDYFGFSGKILIEEQVSKGPA